MHSRKHTEPCRVFSVLHIGPDHLFFLLIFIAYLKSEITAKAMGHSETSPIRTIHLAKYTIPNISPFTVGSAQVFYGEFNNDVWVWV